MLFFLHPRVVVSEEPRVLCYHHMQHILYSMVVERYVVLTTYLSYFSGRRPEGTGESPVDGGVHVVSGRSVTLTP